MKKALIIQKFILTIYFLGSIGILFAQQNKLDQEEKIIFSKNGTIKYIKFGEDETLHYKTSQGKEIKIKVPLNSSDFFIQILKATKDDQFKLIRKRQNRTGYIIEKYAQSYKNIPVKAAKYSLHFYDGKLFKANGLYVRIKNLDIVPSISPSEAMKRFAEFQNIPLSEIKNYENKLLIAEIEAIKDGDIFIEPKLAYEIFLISNHLKNTEIGFVEAHTGEIIKTEPVITDYSATGTFDTRYSDTQTATTQYYNGTYNLCDSTRAAIIRTRNNENHQMDWYTNATEFTDNNNIWTTYEHGSNDDDMALDIHWALQEIYDYFYGSFNGWIGYDSSAFPINAYAHAIINESKDNAAWHNIYHRLFFGDGESTFKPLASLDVVAHEYGHGIEHLNPNLGYTTVEKALKEGLSDIWGAVLEYNIAPAKVHWKIGEEIMDNGKDCLRNIQNPKASNAHTPMADTYGSTIYNYGNYYVKSGVFSHWFYLLSEGGSGTNDLSNDYSVYGIDIDCATEIIFEAEIDHFDGVDSYTEARTATIDAAEELNGVASLEVMQVKNAWYAVGVGTEPDQMYISGSSLVCTSNSTFTLHNRPPGTTVNWTKSSNLQLVSGQGTNNYTVKAYSFASGTGWVQATINSTTCCGSITIPQSVWAGTPQITNKKVDGGSYYPGMQICPGDHALNVTPVGGDAGTATWTVPSGIVYFVGINELDFTFPSSASSVAITTRSTNSCGTGPNSSFYLSKKYYGCYRSYGMILYPNPASDNVTITMIENLPLVEYSDSSINNLAITDAKADEPTIYIIRIYNSQSILLSTWTRSGKSFNIPLINMRDGTYIIEVSDGENSYRQQLFVKHN